MRVFALRAVLMIALAILGVSAISAAMAVGVTGSDATYLLAVTLTSAVLVAAAMWLTRGLPDG